MAGSSRPGRPGRNPVRSEALVMTAWVWLVIVVEAAWRNRWTVLCIILLLAALGLAGHEDAQEAAR